MKIKIKSSNILRKVAEFIWNIIDDNYEFILNILSILLGFLFFRLVFPNDISIAIMFVTAVVMGLLVLLQIPQAIILLFFCLIWELVNFLKSLITKNKRENKRL